MLRIVVQESSAAARRYYSAADYYSQGQEALGLWGGRAAPWLGLSGQVSQEAFAALCDNRHPQTGAPLTQRTNGSRRVGYDFNFSVPKSVSLYYGLTQDQALLAAFRQAVHETMGEIEADMKTRVRRGGQEHDRTTGNLVWAEFVHTTSRPVDGVPDPHLHAHCFAFNATFDPQEKRWKAGQFGDVKRDAAYYQAAFRARLAEKLVGQGHVLQYDGGDFEIAALKTAAKKFQRRTDEIEAEAKRRGITSARDRDGLGARTREKKTTELSEGELRLEWFNRLDSDDRRALGDASQRRGPRALPREDARAVGFAVRHLFEKDAVVAERKLLAEALRHGIGWVSVEGVKDALEKVGLLAADRDGQRLLTTREALATEQRLIARARDGRGTRKPLGKAGRPFSRDWLNSGQKAAVRHLWGSCDATMLVRGAAGAGKTTLLQEAVEGIEANGHKVFAFAPSAGASRGTLREAGFANAQTIAMLLKDERLQQQLHGQVALVDEAGLLAMKDAARFFDLAASLGARVIVVGDTSQHRAVQRPGALRLLEQKAGLPVAEVREIQRQRGQYRQAVERLSRGDTEGGLTHLEALGWVREIADAEQRERQLAADYAQAVCGRAGKGGARTALVISPTHAEGARITQAIRQELKQRGKLAAREHHFNRLDRRDLSEAQRGLPESYAAGDVVQFWQNARGFERGERVTVVSSDATGVRVESARGAVRALPLGQADRFEVYQKSELLLAEGDRVRITANGQSQGGGHRLDNGALYNVAGFTKSGDLMLDNGWVVGKDYGHLTFGYVITSHASQSKTVDQVFIAQSARSFPASSREQFYVSVSRGRDRAVLYTDDRQGLREAIRRSDTRLTATDLLGERARRERLLEHVQHLRRWAGITSQTARQALSRRRPDRGHDVAAPAHRAGAAQERERHRGAEHGR